jgi:hypothetical protein
MVSSVSIRDYHFRWLTAPVRVYVCLIKPRESGMICGSRSTVQIIRDEKGIWPESAQQESRISSYEF